MSPNDTPLAELTTPDGTFLIQERRRAPRETAAPANSFQRGASSTPAMTALGGIIIILVLVATYTTKYEAAIGHRVSLAAYPAVGFLALQLFLARSAYRLFYDIRTMPSAEAYVLSRLLRYLPATIPAVLFGFVLTKTCALACLHADAMSLPANLLMLADMLGVAEVDPSHWRLKIEILLSVFVGVAWFSQRLRHLPLALLALLAFNAFNVHGEPAHESILTLRGILTIDGYLPLVAFGIALHHLVQPNAGRGWWLVLAVSSVLVVLSNSLAHGFVVLGGLGVLGAVATHRLDVIGRATWLVRLGEIAFPIFVIHHVAGFVVIYKLEALGLHPVPAMIVAGLLAVAGGKLLQVAFERPADNFVPVILSWARRAARARFAPIGTTQSA